MFRIIFVGGERNLWRDGTTRKLRVPQDVKEGIVECLYVQGVPALKFRKRDFFGLSFLNCGREDLDIHVSRQSGPVVSGVNLQQSFFFNKGCNLSGIGAEIYRGTLTKRLLLTASDNCKKVSVV